MKFANYKILTLVLYLFMVQMLFAATPVITSTPVTSATQDSSYRYIPTGSDTDGHNLTLNATSGTTLPSWLTLTNTPSVITLAGSTYGYSNGTSAKFRAPRGVAVDSIGNVYVADSTNHRIRKITPSGNVTTLAGSGTAGFANGNGTSAQFDTPTGIAVDSSGNVYVGDLSNNRIRKITPSGDVTTLAGSGTAGFANGSASTAQFNGPYGVTVDSSGNVYVADFVNNRIRKVSSSGNVTTLAGNGTGGFVDGNATTAQFQTPFGVAVDSSGNVYVADYSNNRIRKVTPSGDVTTLAGSATSGSTDANGASATFTSPRGVAVDNSGNVYVADTNNNKIRKITPSGDVTTLAGEGTAAFLDGATATAKFQTPYGIAVDSKGIVYVADTYNNRIRQIVEFFINGTPVNANVGLNDVNLTLSDSTLSTTQNFQITVANVNDAPTGITLSSSSITENNATGTTIGSFSTTDIDVGDTFTYSLCGGTNDGNFSISSNNLQTASVFDYETKSSYSICVRTTDSGSATFDKTIAISITNVNDAPIITSSAVTSGTQGSSYSYTLATSDAENDKLTISVTSGTTLPSWLSLSSTITLNTFAGNGTSGFVDANATTAQFKTPTNMARDSSGNTYVADRINHRIRKITPNGDVTTFAGSGVAGFANANGTSAQFNQPYGIAIDSSDNVYVADRVNQRIRKITPSGDVTTFAGSGVTGFADGAGAKFNSPSGIAVDSSGNVYVADYYNNRVRKITSAGVVSTLAGGSIFGYTNGNGVLARFHYPSGVAVDSSGNVYVADTTNSSIRKVTPSGDVTTLAGNGTAGFVDGNATTARFNLPAGITIDSSGTLYIADTANNRIRKVTSSGDVTTLAGSGTAGFSDGEATSAKLQAPTGVIVDSSGSVYVADSGNNRIRKIAEISKIEGTPTNTNVGLNDVNLTLSDSTLSTTQNFQITVANVNDAPTGITLSSSSITENNATGTTIGSFSTTDIDVGDTFTYSLCGGTNDANFTISSNSLKSASVFDYETKSSYSICVRTTDSGSATFDKTIAISITNVNDAPTVTSTAVTSATQGNSYSYIPVTSDVEGDTITLSATSGTTLPSWLSLNGTTVRTLTGSGATGYLDGNASTAQFRYPSGVAVDSSGNVYIADRTDNRIRKVSSNGDVTTLAGTGTAGFADGNATTAQFDNPIGLTVDSSGNIYVADFNNNRIRKITPSGDVTTLAGSGTSGFLDGNASTAQFKLPLGITVDNSGNVYVGDFSNNRIRKITPSGDVTTLAGSGVSGFTDGNASTAQFNSPKGVSVDSSGNVYVADAGNYRIRKITPSGDVTTLAGSGTAGFLNGNATTARFNNPSGITVDSSANVYVGDLSNNRIRKVTPSGDVTTLGGSGTAGFLNGNAITAQFKNPYGVAVDNSGNVYVADSSNNRIRKILKHFITGTPTNSNVGINDVNLTVNDGKGGTATQNFQITVANVNDAPTDITLSSSSIVENSESGTTVGTLGVTDIDINDTATYALNCTTPGSDDASFTIGGTSLKSNAIFSYATKNSYSICIRVTDSASVTFDKNMTISITKVYVAPVIVTPVDTPPTMNTLSNLTKLEDFNSFSLALGAVDANGDAISYSASSSDPSVATVSIIGGELVVTPVSNANGIISVQVNVSANGKTTTQIFTMSVNAVNDAPTFVTTLENQTVTEDASDTLFNIQLDDVENDTLSFSAESNNTSLVRVLENGVTGIISDTYDKQSFTLHYTSNQYGTAKITLSVSDNNGEVTTQSFTVTVTPVDDPLTVNTFSNIVHYKNFKPFSIALGAKDIDNEIIYASPKYDSSLFNIAREGDNLNFTSIDGATGRSDVDINISGGSLTRSIHFNVYIPAIDTRKVTVTTDANKTLTIYKIDDNLSMEITQDINGTVKSEIKVGGSLIKITSTLDTSIVEFLVDKMRTFYIDDTKNLKVEVNASVTGRVVQNLDLNGTITQIISEYLGATTLIDKDNNGSIRVLTTVKMNGNNISVATHENGNIQGSISIGNLTTRAFCEIKGAKTIIDINGNVITTLLQDFNSTTNIEAVIRIAADGTSTTRFQFKAIQANVLQGVRNTLSTRTSYSVGNVATIKKVADMLYIETRARITDDLVVE